MNFLANKHQNELIWSNEPNESHDPNESHASHEANEHKESKPRNATQVRKVTYLGSRCGNLAITGGALGKSKTG